MGDITIPIKTYPYTRKYETKNITKFKYIHYGDIHTGKAKKINEPSKLPSITKGNYSTLRNGDVVVADASEDYKGIADAAILLSTGAFSIIAGLHTIAFRPNRKLVFPMFIYYNLQTSRFKHYGYHVGTGLKVFGISSNLFFDYSAFHPSLIEQQEISKLIESLENLLSLQQRKLEQLKQLKKAMLQQLFVDKNNKQPNLRFKNFKGNWEQHRLEEVAQVTMGQSPSSKNYTDNPNDYVLVQGNADLKSNRISPRVWTKEVTKQVHKGEIIMTVRAPVGYLAMANMDAVIGRGVAAIDGNKYLYYLLQTKLMDRTWEKLSSGSTFESISSNGIKNLEIKVTETEEEKLIAKLMDTVTYFVTLQKNNLTQLTTLKNYLLQNLFI
ncbi:restriction endonuclease subunit S [Limosilactobacillus reuteri]|uniref:restriction endonuclease subunit S n=2 Tax=Limosilactobacillus reuteri TaxID=1598 RepID=UPI0015FCE554|nr:restriction endonuclease subunit S [Limosilactobacillus reuteri]MBB1072469.1 restriction endonuclease subunit S [Limosilactobacillus reuteri]MCC4513580.1 restriction endonuclease subunit S [Limosilactobacillus reuteri]